MSFAAARRPTRSLSSGVLLAFIVLAFALQASFIVGLAKGDPAGNGPAMLVAGEHAAPCVNG